MEQFKPGASPQEQFVSKFVVPANDIPRVGGKPTRRILLLSIALAMTFSFIYVDWDLGELGYGKTSCALELSASPRLEVLGPVFNPALSSSSRDHTFV